jgi:hypothetical protein
VQRQFHHKGGGPCDHCGVLGAWLLSIQVQED